MAVSRAERKMSFFTFEKSEYSEGAKKLVEKLKGCMIGDVMKKLMKYNEEVVKERKEVNLFDYL
jgi:hypothetical protein